MAWTGLLIAIVGFWVLMRSIRKDTSGRTLVDRLLGNPPAAAHG